MNVSWDPTTVMRDAMADQLEMLIKTSRAVDPNDEDAPEMQRRLQAQIDDLERRIHAIDIKKSTQPSPTQSTPTETKPAVASRSSEEMFADVVEVQTQLQAEQKVLKECLAAIQDEQRAQRDMLKRHTMMLQRLMLAVDLAHSTL